VFPFSVVVKVMLYVPAGVAPLAPLGKLAQDPVPSAITIISIANATVTRRFLLNIPEIPASRRASSPNEIPPPKPPGTNPTVVVAPWQNV
jgi:hypothetical protein